MIASFSRAINDSKKSMNDGKFDSAPVEAIDEIYELYEASVYKG